MATSKVYFLPFGKRDGIPACIEKISPNLFKKHDFVALKLHFGEKGNKGHIDPKWLIPTVRYVKDRGAYPFLTDTNTIYRGERSDAVHHSLIAHGHGFKIEKVGAPVIIADGLRGNDFVSVEVGGEHFRNVRIARGIFEANAMIVLSHTKGHILTGFGGALKNLGMGCGSKGGKYEMHDAAFPRLLSEKCVACGECVKWCPSGAMSIKQKKARLDESKCVGCGECILSCKFGAIDIPWDLSPKKVQERMVEYALGATKNKACIYVNFLNFITRDCDCFATPDEGALLDEIGLLVSDDPVAIDQASIDQINKKAGRDFFKGLHPNIDCTVQLQHAEKMGLGGREYELVEYNG